MGERADRDRSDAPFALVVFVACLSAVGLTFRLATGSSAQSPIQSEAVTGEALSTVELRALAGQATVRVAAGSCGSVTRGSGFVVGDWLLTNEHVVRGASELKADQPIEPVIVPIVHVSVATDLAAAEAPFALSLDLAVSPAGVGDRVLVAGHADGGAIESREAVVVNRVRGTAFGFDGDVLLLDVPTRPGYSGGPVLDTDGDVVGMLSGFDRATDLSLAVPADEIAAFLASLSEFPASATGPEPEPCPAG